MALGRKSNRGWIGVVVISLTLCANPCAASETTSTSPLIPIPYQGRLEEVGLLNSDSATIFEETASMDKLFAIARSFRYLREPTGQDRWQSPQETQRLRTGDCEDKAIWLFDQLRQNGYEDIQLVIGKYRRYRSGLHVWLLARGPDGMMYILDPAAQRRIWKIEDFPADLYRPIYSCDGRQMFRHRA